MSASVKHKMTRPQPGGRRRSTVRHTRAIQYARTKHPNSAPLDPRMSEHVAQLLHPATFAQVAHQHALGVRDRVLNLPVMVAVVLAMIWRQIGSVCELTRLLNTEGFFWCSP